jgi:hypothetical protein
MLSSSKVKKTNMVFQQRSCCPWRLESSKRCLLAFSIPEATDRSRSIVRGGGNWEKLLQFPCFGRGYAGFPSKGS